MAKRLTRSQLPHSALQSFVSTLKSFSFTWLNSRAWVSVNQGCRTDSGYETCYTTWNCVKVKKKPGLQGWSRRYRNEAVLMLQVSPGSQARVNNLLHREFHLSWPTSQTAQTSSFTSKRFSRVLLILLRPLSPGLHLLLCFPHLFTGGFKTLPSLERSILF